ncbi:Uncharacterised protein [Klebsiella quasipneumoniae]|uniref:Uncharacterized protein n=1 Tax=Klebsiella pneumoniae TaxID=573 RepID=A0A486T2P4_KLEPN|nr:Uncharacterised protein [Klebsiella quasipneumoniae]VGG34863.1 Uncharacterised protein [Klebsiella pneumoniae]VFZ93152.1 Uncharacterised protein [Klebsiella quasipneumoniae]VGL55236.1 Uncharacterised protein [Klebsiella pneumoniae]VGL94146.1 Uncharacterised protein [Klebsiella pneumoniae]
MNRLKSEFKESAQHFTSLLFYHPVRSCQTLLNDFKFFLNRMVHIAVKNAHHLSNITARKQKSRKHNSRVFCSTKELNVHLICQCLPLQKDIDSRTRQFIFNENTDHFRLNISQLT